MKSIVAYLTEATLDQTKDVLKKAEWSREKTDALYPKLFNTKKYKTDSRHYRIYLPFEFDQKIPENFLYWDGHDDFESFVFEITEMFGKDTSTMRDVFDNFRQYANEDEFSFDRFDYQNGYVFDKRDRPVRIVKVFNELIKQHPTELKSELEPLIKRFNEDRLRDGNTKIDFGRLMIVVSKNPLDILNQSTDRKWTSCMDLTHGVNKNYVAEDLKYGTIVAYLTETNDVNLRNPLARISIKPYHGAMKNKIRLVPSTMCYHVLYGEFVESLVQSFRKRVNDFVEENFNSKITTNDVFYMNKNLYFDNTEGSNDIHELNPSKIDSEAILYKKIKPYGGDLVWDIGYGLWVFNTNNNRQGIVSPRGIVLSPQWTEIEEAGDARNQVIVSYGDRKGLYNFATEEWTIYPPNSKITQMTNFYSHERVGQRILSDGELRDGTKVYISPDGQIEER